MTVRRIARLVLGLACTGLAATAAGTGEAGPLERLFTRHYGYVPACDSGWALGTISRHFAHNERRFWASSAAITDFGEVRELAYRPWGPNFIPRRFCRAKVRIAGVRDTMVYYSITERAGFAGVGWGVEWCVVGYDRNLAYTPNCRAARP